MDSAPICSARSIAVWIPPADETCAPIFTSTTLSEPSFQARRLLLDLAPGGAGEGCERNERDRALPICCPRPRDDAVDEERLRHVAVLRDHGLAQVLREDAPPGPRVAAVRAAGRGAPGRSRRGSA